MASSKTQSKRAPLIGTGPAQRLCVTIVMPPGWAGSETELTQRIRASPLLRLVEGAEEAELTVHGIEPRQEAEFSDPAPGLGAVEARVCVVVDRDNQLVAPFERLDEPQALAHTIDNLERRARYLNALRLQTPPGSPLDGRVEFVLKRRVEGADWVDAEPWGSKGEYSFEDEEDFGFEITNRYEKPIFVYVLDFGVGGAVELIYPPSGAGEPLVPNHHILVGDEPGQELTFCVPETFPFDTPGERPAAGWETLKLFATIEATDLQPIFQQSHGDRPGWSGRISESSLGQLLAEIFLDPHEFRRGESRRDKLWATMDRRVFLRRP